MYRSYCCANLLRTIVLSGSLHIYYGFLSWVRKKDFSIRLYSSTNFVKCALKTKFPFSKAKSSSFLFETIHMLESNFWNTSCATSSANLKPNRRTSGYEPVAQSVGWRDEAKPPVWLRDKRPTSRCCEAVARRMTPLCGGETHWQFYTFDSSRRSGWFLWWVRISGLRERCQIAGKQCVCGSSKNSRSYVWKVVVLQNACEEWTLTVLESY